MITTVRSELYKFRTTPGPWIIVGVTMVLTGLFALIEFHTGTGWGPPTHTIDLRDLVGAGYNLATLVTVPLLGVLCITTEYRHKSITNTLVVSPRRGEVLMAKAVTTIVWAIIMGIATVVVVAAMAIPWFLSAGAPLSSLFDQIGPVLPGLFGAFICLGLFGLGFGILVRNQVAGVIIVVAFMLVLQTVLLFLVYALTHWVLNWLPGQATAALAGGLTRHNNNNSGSDSAVLGLLTWWQGGIAMLAWGLIPGVIGYFTTFRRDVT